jgi:hypothetical protein
MLTASSEITSNFESASVYLEVVSFIKENDERPLDTYVEASSHLRGVVRAGVPPRSLRIARAAPAVNLPSERSD